jgi:hypothetical protein
MIFGFATEAGVLKVFGSAAAAVAHCAGSDVAEGRWLFFAHDGSPMDAVYSQRSGAPAQTAAADIAYTLAPAPQQATRHLLSLLPAVTGVDGPPDCASIQAVKRVLGAQTDPIQSRLGRTR